MLLLSKMLAGLWAAMMSSRSSSVLGAKAPHHEKAETEPTINVNMGDSGSTFVESSIRGSHVLTGTPPEDIPLLDDCNLDNWRFVAAGGASAVFRYTGSAAELRLTVLKVRKKQLAEGWALRIELANLLSGLRSAATAAAGSGGTDRAFRVGAAAELYSSIAAKYLPLQRVVRVPRDVVDCLLRRAALESGGTEVALAPPDDTQVAEMNTERGILHSEGFARTSAATEGGQPSELASSQISGAGRAACKVTDCVPKKDSSYVLCILEDDLVTAPASAASTAAVGLQAARRGGSRHAHSGPQQVASSSSETETSRNTTGGWPEGSLPAVYYAVELKPKCGLMEPLEEVLPEVSGLPKRVAVGANVGPEPPGTCPLSGSGSTVTPSMQSTEKRAGEFSEEVATPTRTPTDGDTRHFLAQQAPPTHYAEASEEGRPDPRTQRHMSVVCDGQGNRFRMQQFLKLREGHIPRPSLFDPVDFFKCTRSTIRSQLSNLLENPQNNLVLFVDGSRMPHSGNLSKVDSEARSASSAEAGHATGAPGHIFLRLVLERIWELEKNLFAGILVLQAFAAGQQHISVQVVSELKRVLGASYGRHRESHLLRSLDAYTEVGPDPLCMRSLLAITAEFCRERLAASRIEAAAAGTLSAHTMATLDARTPSRYEDAVSLQRTHRHEGLDILSSLREIQREQGSEYALEGSSLVDSAFRWLRQYLLGRTFMDVSIMTNVLTTEEGAPLAREVQGTDHNAARNFSRFERLQLDEELRAGAALLLEDHARATASQPHNTTAPSQRETTTPRHLPAVFYRATVIDMDVKPDGSIEKWSKQWTTIQKVFMRTRAEGET